MRKKDNRIATFIIEMRWYLFWSAVMIVLTTLPYVVGYIASNEEWKFEGILISAQDSRSYLAKMRQGGDGLWLWQLSYTHEPHTGGPFYVFYMLLGKFCRVFSLSLITGYHFARILGGIFLSWAIYQTLVDFSVQSTQRKIAFYLALVGSGWGWLWLLLSGESQLGKMPVDLWVPDGYAWFTMLIAPHYVLSHAFLLLALGKGLRFVQTGMRTFECQAMLWVLLSVLMRPYSILTIVLLLGLWSLAHKWGRWRSIAQDGLHIVGITLPSVPYILWAGWLFLQTPAFSEWARQSTNPSPPPWYFLLGYAPYLLLAFLLVFDLCRLSNFKTILIWVIIGGLIVYVPLSAQRRFLEGWEFPWAVLAAEGLVLLYQRLHLPKRWRRMIVAFLMLFTALTTLMMVFGAALSAASHAPAIFLRRDEVALYDWLDAQTSRRDVVLASYATSNRLPAYASLRVVWGLETETIHGEEKAARVTHFFGDGDTEDRTTLLCDWTITYIVWGPREKAMGAFDPSTAPYLHQVGAWGEWTLWAVEEGLCSE